MVMYRKARLRHRAREVALQLVYMLDMRPDTPPQEALELLSADEALELFSAELAEEGAGPPDKKKFPSVAAFDLSLSDSEREDVLAYATELFRGVRSNRAKIEDIIRENMESKWRPERLVAIDKAVISLALYEGTIAQNVPVNVAISEAVEIAKAFGTEESGRFVNGVLGRIVRSDNEHE